LVEYYEKELEIQSSVDNSYYKLIHYFPDKSDKIEEYKLKIEHHNQILNNRLSQLDKEIKILRKYIPIWYAMLNITSSNK